MLGVEPGSFCIHLATALLPILSWFGLVSFQQHITHIHVVSKGFIASGKVVEVFAGWVKMIFFKEILKNTLLLHDLPHGLESLQWNSVWDGELGVRGWKLFLH